MSLDGRLARLNSLADLRQNWDTYGAPPISRLAIAAAAQELRDLGDTPPPYVYPTTAGGVQFEWDEGDACMCVEFYDDGTYEAVAFHTDDQDDGPPL